MHATLKYPGQRAKLRSILAVFAVCLCARIAAGDEPNFLAEAETAYKAAQSAYATNSQSLEAAVDLARTAFDYADLAPNDTIRENVANNGIATARTAILGHTNSVAAHYYLALNIGQLA